MDVAELQPHQHDTPSGWPVETFERLTDAIAAALVAAYGQHEQAGRSGSSLS